jgi:hypothetical protein
MWQNISTEQQHQCTLSVQVHELLFSWAQRYGDPYLLNMSGVPTLVLANARDVKVSSSAI